MRRVTHFTTLRCMLSPRNGENSMCRQNGNALTVSALQCSASCGKGITRRHVICSRVIGGQSREVGETDCKHLSKPRTFGTCTERPCEPLWYNTEWSQVTIKRTHSRFITREHFRYYRYILIFKAQLYKKKFQAAFACTS